MLPERRILFRVRTVFANLYRLCRSTNCKQTIAWLFQLFVLNSRVLGKLSDAAL
jgi:hypothetical protein